MIDNKKESLIKQNKHTPVFKPMNMRQMRMYMLLHATLTPAVLAANPTQFINKENE